MNAETDEAYLKTARESFDATWSQMYRSMDEADAGPESPFTHYGDRLEALSTAAGRRIDVLDAGCGTGRYFHRLRNVNRLVGMDLSADMLEQAKRPVHADRLQAGSIELLCGELLALKLPAASFDLVYSVGVYGEYAPLDERLVGEFRRLLRPGGVLFVTAVESTSRVSEPENSPMSLPRRVVRKLFPHLPPAVRRLVNRGFSPFYTTRPELQRVFSSCGFDDVDIAAYVHRQGWAGTHWDCTARLR